MKSSVCIKDNKITSIINLPNGYYDIDIKEKDVSKTWEQTKKLWATVDDISRHEYGDVSQSSNIYLQILKMAGIRTDLIRIPEEALKDFQKKCRAYEVLAHETISHMPYLVLRVCFVGISEMSKKEASSVIETAIRYCAEIGIQTDLEEI